MEANPDAWFRQLPDRIARARGDIAAFLRVPAGHLAFVPNASAGVSTVLNSSVLPPGGRILLSDHGYGSVAMGARRAAARAGLRVETVHVPLDADDEAVESAFARALTGDGATPAGATLVIVDQITSPTARLFPVAAVVRRAHLAGARVLVDGAHAPGMLADPLAHAGDADFWTGNLHKWACAPRGTAALVARGPHGRELTPLTDSWGAQEPFPANFDHQGTLDLTSWLSAADATGFIEARYGWDRARAHMSRLAGLAQATLARALRQDLTGVTVGEAPAMRLVPLPAGLATEPLCAAELQRHIARETGCETSITSWDGRGFLRLSAHLYNTPEDYEYLAELLPGCL
ncbi:aminotransferase class V [Streptomyces tsukubensis]|uniref:Aminotransferase class V n=2 Tax=Streptomyces tsukubensis TaxID=83656 RepID=A0A1V4A8K0_9ACTN|nr:aminotransferase class V [Streptomyces tsukubensis]